MPTDLEALLALQADDLVIHALEERLAALEPRLKDLELRKQRVTEALGRSAATVGAEEKKQAWLRDKIAEHKQLIERNQSQMDIVKTMKQATAAVAQMEQAKKIVAGEESDLLAVNRRLEELRGVRGAQEAELASVEAELSSALNEVSRDRTEIEADLGVARGKRGMSAEGVPPALRGKYERIRGKRRVEAVFPMHNMSCGNCDTAIPMQRRHIMNNSGAIDLCEACGVLMYMSA